MTPPIAERVSGYQTPPMVTDQSATMVIDDMTTQLYGKLSGPSLTPDC